MEVQKVLVGVKRLDEWADKLHDRRLQELLPLYKARNYPAQLTQEERKTWETFCKKRLMDGGQNSRLADRSAPNWR